MHVTDPQLLRAPGESRATLDLARARAGERLLGPEPAGRWTRIVLTLDESDSETAFTAAAAAGVDLVRVNTARGEPADWARAAEIARRARTAAGRPPQVIVDLLGRKPRLGPLASGPAVAKWRPWRDAWGRVIRPARVWLSPSEAPSPPRLPADASAQVAGAWLAGLASELALEFADTRSARRRLLVLAAFPEGCLCACDRTAYVTNGTALHRADAPTEDPASWAHLAGIPAERGTIPLVAGETLILTPGRSPGRPAERDRHGRALVPARVSCDRVEVFRHARPGQRLVVGDGEVTGTISRVTEEAMTVTIAEGGGGSLRAGRTVHFPDSDLDLPALAAEDADALAFAVASGDLVALSSTESAADVAALEAALADAGGAGLGRLFKIASPRAVAKLPEILAAAAGSTFGLVIERGGLVAEAGFERLASLQETVLAAGHEAGVPVVWAGQVLEGLARDGCPSWAEVSDVAAAARADAVLLHRGRHAVKAVAFLDDQLRRAAEASPGPTGSRSAEPPMA